MIDVNIFVYVGTLAIFVICAFAVGVLSFVASTVLAVVVAIRRERTIQPAGKVPAAVQDLDWFEDQEDEPSGRAVDLVGLAVTAVRRPGRPRLIQHTQGNRTAS